jgi:hypothetical protein
VIASGRYTSFFWISVLLSGCTLPIASPRVEKPRAPLDQGLAVVHQEGGLRLIRGVNCPGIYVYTVSFEHDLAAQRCGDHETEVKTFKLSDLSGVRSLESRELRDTSNWGIVGPYNQPRLLIPFSKDQKYTTIGNFDPMLGTFKSSGLEADADFQRDFRLVDDCLVLNGSGGGMVPRIFIPNSDVNPITLLPKSQFNLYESKGYVKNCKIIENNGQKTIEVIAISTLEYTQPDRFRQPDGSYEYRGRKLTRTGDRVQFEGFVPLYDRKWELEKYSLPDAASGLVPTFISRSSQTFSDADSPGQSVTGIWLDANQIRTISPMTGKLREWSLPDLGPLPNEIKSSRDALGTFAPRAMDWFLIGSLEEQELRLFIMRPICLKARCEYDETSSALSLVVCTEICVAKNWTLPQTGVASFEIKAISADRRSIALGTSMFHNGQPDDYLLVVKD